MLNIIMRLHLIIHTIETPNYYHYYCHYTSKFLEDAYHTQQHNRSIMWIYLSATWLFSPSVIYYLQRYTETCTSCCLFLPWQWKNYNFSAYMKLQKICITHLYPYHPACVLKTWFSIKQSVLENMKNYQRSALLLGWLLVGSHVF